MCFLNSAAPPPWSNLYIYAHTELDEHHNIVLLVVASFANIPAAEILQATCCQSCHIALLRNIFVVKILLYLVPVCFSS